MSDPHLHSIAFERVTVAEAKAVHDGPSAPEAKADWPRRRAANNAEPLHPQAREWIQGLPPDLRLEALTQHYARIANKICSLWPKPEQCTEYLEELLIVRRVRRQGFPAEVAKDIAKITAHYARLNRYRSIDTSWKRAS
jgi:hypothetical protein